MNSPGTIDQALENLVQYVARDPLLCGNLEKSYLAEEREQLISALSNLLPEKFKRAIKDPWSRFLTYCTEHADEIPLKIVVALKRRKADGKRYRHRRDHFATSVGLSPSTKGRKLKGIPEVSLPSLDEPYPPPGYDIYESGPILNIWKKHHKETLYPDRRDGRTWKEFHELDPSKLQYTVAADKSAIFRDAKSGQIIGLVIRNFSGKPKLLDSVNKIIMENTEVRKSVRLEDPGRLCQIGYTAGSRSDPKLGWARNLLGKQPDTAVNRMMYESSSVFALFWNILRQQLPEEITEDFDKWLGDNDMVRMDTKGSQDTAEGMYTVQYGDEKYEFHGVEMPPPSGVFGTNYTRFMHKEGSGHTYAAAWTTMRDPELGEDGGGHFFLCEHGIKVEAAADSLVVWRPKSHHGTSLQRRLPTDPRVFQAGLSIVTPAGVSRLWKEVLEKKISLEEARFRMLQLESEEQA